MKFIGDAMRRHRKFGRRGSTALPKFGGAMVAARHRLREAGALSELATRRKW